MISLTINGQTLEVPENTTILQAAGQAGIVIPTLCYHKDLTPYGGCRLCSVDVSGMRLPATACTMLVAPGMVVQTESPELTRYRRTILELLLVRFYDAGYTQNGSNKSELDTQFAHWVRHYGIDMKRAMAKRPFRRIDSDPNPFIWVDKNKCIMCTRCVRACAEVQGRFVWTQAYRGYDLQIVAGADTTMLQARCESCGACVAHCPTGALDNRMSVKLGPPDRTVATICPYCGVGCETYLNIKDDIPGGRVISVSSRHSAPVNGDHLCVKGRYGYDFIQASNRLSVPRVRRYLLDGAARPARRGPWVNVDWKTALDLAARGIKDALDHYGPDSVGLLASGKALNEENFLMNKLARQAIGTNNIDCAEHMSRSSVVEGLQASTGLPAMSTSLDDIANHARCILVIGSNITEDHPVFGSRIRQAVLRRKAQVITLCPVFWNIEEYAALPLRHKRGAEAVILNGLMHILVKRGWQDSQFVNEHTKGFEEFRAALDRYSPDRVTQVTGVAEDRLMRAAEIIATNRPLAIIWGSDLTSTACAADNVTSLANLQMLMGGFSDRGAGLVPLRSDNNSQGASDMGANPAYLPGYQPITNEQARVKFEAAWGMKLPVRPGLSASQMLEAARMGSLKALFMLNNGFWKDGTAGLIRRSLDACPFVVMCETLPSEMSRYADVLLASVTFAETGGTYTNTERRIQLVRQALQPQGDAEPQWRILAELAHRLCASGTRRLGDGICPGWEYASTSDIMEEIASLTPIYSGVSHTRLQQGGPLMWPVRGADHGGTERLIDTSLADERFTFVPIQA